ncbi:MAG TPA: hypothetical protein VD905_12640 [Flavobacteriales bacterium]|nr:hypothetical protein [Flavobacteriales bacterium]
MLTALSCKKESKKTVITGYVKDYYSGYPLSGVEVYLQESDQTSTSFDPVNQRTYASVITGTDGKFSFEFRALKDKQYGLEYQKPSACYFDNESQQIIHTGEKNEIEKKLHSYGTLYLHFQNTTPYDSLDHICYAYNPAATTCMNTGYTGTAVNVTETLQLNLYDKVYFKSFITKNGITTTRLDSITFTVTCSSATLDILY